MILSRIVPCAIFCCDVPARCLARHVLPEQVLPIEWLTPHAADPPRLPNLDFGSNDTCAWTPNKGGPTERAPTEDIPELRNSFFRMFGNIAEKNTFSNSFVEGTFCRKCSWGACATFTNEFSIIFHEGLFSSWNHIFLAVFLCRFRTRSRMFAFGWLTVGWEWLERTLGGQRCLKGRWEPNL